MSEQNEPQKSGVSRRTVAKAMAWSVPAIAVAATVPNAAASVRCLTATFEGNSCKQPGSGNDFGYRLRICFRNICNTPITVTVTQVAANTGNAVVLPVNQGPLVVPANGSACLPADVLYCSNNSANFINVSYTIQGQTGTFVAQVASPVQDCRPEDQFCGPAPAAAATVEEQTATTPVEEPAVPAEEAPAEEAPADAPVTEETAPATQP